MPPNANYTPSPNANAHPAPQLSAIDRTRYGRATSSPHSFMQYHSQRLSRAAVMADAAAICKKSASEG
eukprot:scaffold1301_cov135-Isochrysis_galbana.AAC.4